MANKLSEIFSDDMFNINGKMRFKDDEAYKKFLSALEMVQSDGRVVPIEGVTSIVTEIQDSSGKYPFQEHTNISDLIIGPVKENVEFEVSVDGKKETIQLSRYQISEGVVLETKRDAVIYFKFIFPQTNLNKHTVQYKVQFGTAKTIRDIVAGVKLAIAMLDKLYRDEDLKSADEDGAILVEVKKRFGIFVDYFNRLLEVEAALNLIFDPNYLDTLSVENQNDIEELYVLLCKKDVIRLNAKINSTDATNIVAQNKDKLKIGSDIKLTFLGTITYQLFGHTISLHSTNLLSNAVVKGIHEDDEKTQILYGDTDARPMYISYMAFATEEEAKSEMSNIFEHEDVYVNAKTLKEHILQYGL